MGVKRTTQTPPTTPDERPPPPRVGRLDPLVQKPAKALRVLVNQGPVGGQHIDGPDLLLFHFHLADSLVESRMVGTHHSFLVGWASPTILFTTIAFNWWAMPTLH